MQRYYHNFGKEKTWFKGCLALPENANLDKHEKAFVKFNDLLGKYCKAVSIKIKYRGVYHITNDHNKHLDYVGWSDEKNMHKIKHIWHRAAKKAGFKIYSCKQIATATQFDGWTNYLYKRWKKGGDGKHLIYLASHDKTDIIRASNNFFEGTSHKDLWEQIREDASSNKDSSNKDITTHQRLYRIYEILESKIPDNDKIVKLLPYKEADGIPPMKLRWLTGWSNEKLLELISDNPSIRWSQGKIYLDNPLVVETSWEDRLFGEFGLPYHPIHFPRKQAQAQQTEKETPRWTGYIPQGEEADPINMDDFFAELQPESP